MRIRARDRTVVRVMTTDAKRTAAHQIAAPTGLDPRSVLAVLDGRRVRLSTRKAVERAAADLGIAIPRAAA